MTVVIESNIKTEEPKIKKFLIIFTFSIILMTTYSMSFFLIMSAGEKTSSVFLFWAIITPYMIYIMNYFKEQRKNKKILKLIIDELKILLLEIVGLSKKHGQIFINSMIDSFRERFRNELRNIYCFIEDNKLNNKKNITIYTKEGKYIADNSSIFKYTSEGKISYLSEEKVNNLIKEVRKTI